AYRADVKRGAVDDVAEDVGTISIVPSVGNLSTRSAAQILHRMRATGIGGIGFQLLPKSRGGGNATRWGAVGPTERNARLCDWIPGCDESSGVPSGACRLRVKLCLGAPHESLADVSSLWIDRKRLDVTGPVLIGVGGVEARLEGVRVRVQAGGVDRGRRG